MKCLFTIGVFLSPIYSLMLLVVGFVLFDTITAIWVTIKLNGRKSFRSGKLWNIFPKIFFYSGCILLTFLIDVHIFNNYIFGIHYLLSKATSVVALWIEGTSINENSMKLGNRSIDLIIRDIVSKLKVIKKDINEIRE